MKTAQEATYETLFEKLTSSIINFIKLSEFKYPLKDFRQIQNYLDKTLENYLNLDDHISKGLNENLDLKNTEFKNQPSEIKKIEFALQLFAELQDFLLRFVEIVHIAANFFEEFKDNKRIFECFIKDQLWKEFKDYQSSLFKFMKKVVDRIKIIIETDMKKNYLNIVNFYDLRILSNFKKEEFSFKIDKALKEEKFEINLPDFVKVQLFKYNLVLEKWNFSEYSRIYTKSYAEIDEKIQTSISKSILNCLQNPERFLMRIKKIDLSLLAQIFFLSTPDRLSSHSIEIHRKINQGFYDSYFSKILEERIFLELMRFFDPNIFKNERKGMLKELDSCTIELGASELRAKNLLKIIVFFTISCIDEKGRINLELRNKLKYVFRNLMTQKFSFSTYHIFNLIEKLFQEMVDKKYFIRKKNKKTRALTKEIRDIFVEKDIYVKDSFLSNLRNNLCETETKLDHFLNKIQMKVTHIKRPNIFKIKLISHEVISRVPVICVSGYLSQDTDKIEEWNSLCFHLPKCEIISLSWESGDIGIMLSNLMKGKEALGVLYNCNSLINFVLTLCYKSYSLCQNIPFIQEFEEARSVGVYLAHFLAGKESSLMHGFNLMGFSLGTYVIFNCLVELEKINSERGKHGKLVHINDVVLMGSVIDKDEINKLSLKSIAGNLINCYSENDYVLKYLLRIIKPSVSPIGIQKILHDDPKVIDCDCSDIIDGHMDYRTKMDLVLHRIDYNADFHLFN